MNSLPSSWSRLVLRSQPSRHLAAAATRAVSTSTSQCKPAVPPSDTAQPITVHDLPIEALNIASSSSSSTALTPRNRIKVPKPNPLLPGKAARVLTRTGRARQLLSWTWLSDKQRAELEQSLGATESSDANLPSWLEHEHESAKSFCEARSRLWIPSALPSGVEAESVQAWLSEKIAEVTKRDGDEALRYAPVETRLDEILKPVWKGMTEQERENAFIECRFSSLRKLGWRSGYSAGFPVRESEVTDERRAILAKCKLGGSEGAQGLVALQSLDDELAWDSWLAMSPLERSREEAEAWSVRDRSAVYLDNSPSSQIVGRIYPRWFETPQRAGQLVFLPNFIIRLVRNYTPRGKSYDPWKATFRVPLNLHKHSLRSFLLSVYGLRTTWIRSMIYRAPVRRGGSFRTQKVAGSVGTWKKVEVGLLEPFVYPAMSERFKKDILMQDEVKREQALTQMKLSGTKRWRGGRPVQRSLAPEHLQKNHYPDSGKPLTLEEEEAKLVAHVGSPPDASDKGDVSRSKGLFNLTTRSGLHPTKRHSNILKVLNGLRKERMRLIEERAEELKDPRVTRGKNGETTDNSEGSEQGRTL